MSEFLSKFIEENPGAEFQSTYNYDVDGVIYTVYDGNDYKICESSDNSYHYTYDKDSGFFARWGATEEDDPEYCPAGPEILDLEISINGCPPVGDGGTCKFCYKGNTSGTPTNMTFDTFKKIIDKMPKILTQIAFGLTGIQTNPDFLKMMEYSRSVGIVPNFTLSGVDLTDEIAEKVSKMAGAIAVSAYESDKNVCYDTVKKLTDLGMDQINIHIMVSQETIPFVLEVVKDRLSDERLSKMNAIVFLGVKPKGRAKGNYHSLSAEKYAILVSHCLSLGISFGFDSCSAPKFEKAVDNMNIKPEFKKNLKQMSESCESSTMSAYINTYGKYFPCSFAEGEGEWVDGVNVFDCDNFLNDVWYNNKTKLYRRNLISSMCRGCRKCLIFDVIN